MITWQCKTVGAHLLIGSPDLAAHQPFDIDNWCEKWAYRLQDVDTKVLIVHQLAIECLNEIPVEHIAAAWAANMTIIVLDDEGMPTSLTEINSILDQLCALGIPYHRMMIWSDAGPQSGAKIASGQSLAAFSIPDTTRVATYGQEISHHWIMLARVPRRHRVIAACEIIDRGLQSLGHMSCGSGGYEDYTYGPGEFQLVPARLRPMFPIYLDGPVAHSDMAIHTNSVLHPAVTGAFVQLVCESNWEDPDTAVSGRWKTMQLSEKSSKPLLLGQLFILNSAAGTVAALRDLGFDCFDDVIDHAYDSETDALLRVSKTVDQLQLICAKPLTYWQQWRKENTSRLLRNRQLFLDIARDLPTIHRHRFQQAIKHIDTQQQQS
jgi:hypothetical protein